jgi:hypothetical protein
MVISNKLKNKPSRISTIPFLSLISALILICCNNTMKPFDSITGNWKFIAYYSVNFSQNCFDNLPVSTDTIGLDIFINFDNGKVTVRKKNENIQTGLYSIVNDSIFFNNLNPDSCLLMERNYHYYYANTDSLTPGESIYYTGNILVLKIGIQNVSDKFIKMIFKKA